MGFIEDRGIVAYVHQQQGSDVSSKVAIRDLTSGKELVAWEDNPYLPYRTSIAFGASVIGPGVSLLALAGSTKLYLWEIYGERGNHVWRVNPDRKVYEWPTASARVVGIGRMKGQPVLAYGDAFGRLTLMDLGTNYAREIEVGGEIKEFLLRDDGEVIVATSKGALALEWRELQMASKQAEFELPEQLPGV